jgi:hypothetical protein
VVRPNLEKAASNSNNADPRTPHDPETFKKSSKKATFIDALD